jgi:hypothetical protein
MGLGKKGTSVEIVSGGNTGCGLDGWNNWALIKLLFFNLMEEELDKGHMR